MGSRTPVIIFGDTSRRILAIPLIVELNNVLHDLRWMILLAILLILGDFWFGISESQYKGIPIRGSRAGRGLFNKAIDYLLYILIAAALGMSFGAPYGLNPAHIAATTLLVLYAFELDSIWGHICVIHGVSNPISFWRILLLIITFRYKTLGKLLSDMVVEVKDNKKKSKKKVHHDR